MNLKLTLLTRVLTFLLFAAATADCDRLGELEISPGPSSTPLPEPSPTGSAAVPTVLSDEDMVPIDVEESLITNLYERVNSAVVHISARIVTMNFFFGSTPSEGTGSGFIVDEFGHIVTNFHVIEGAETIEVTFFDETKVAAEVIGTDPLNDLAILKPEELPQQVSPVTLGSSNDLLVASGRLPLAILLA